MDHDHAAKPQRPRPAVAPRHEAGTRREASEVSELLELQRTAGNQAVTSALTSVQRHSLNPEEMDQG